MKELLEKFLDIKSEIEGEKGALELFALFRRQESPGKWDVLVSAPWIDNDKKSALNYIISKISSKLNTQELISLSRVVILDPTDEFLKEIRTAVRTEQRPLELRDRVFNGMAIAHAYILTSRPDAASKSAADPVIT